ncbi:MAG: thioredoxin family protein [Candidatus Cloacimonetes bacterium]|jgi:thiol-disulfide isomerase/thioredoxin|nr:thioredoxin family protein [Candidatus Cloacimonadota bacterium]MBT6994167.1 thioredoxin family protein [Candidatus Cloacimonadota bacterium]MBT7469744.1 thioredoxin family protein [Candidatus Cloacimonadota bacterium]
MDFEKIKQEKFSFVYLTTKTCNVCKILQPKLRKLANEFDDATFHKIYLEEFPEATGDFMAFAVPTFVVYVEGREVLRTARHISIDNVREKLSRLYGML